MALHKDEPEKLNELQQLFPELFKFFENYVLEDLMKLIPFMKDEHNIQELNKIFLGNFAHLNEENLFCPETSVGEFKKVLNATENVSISSNLPWLVASSLVRHMGKTGVKKIDSSHIFIEIQQLVEVTYFEKIIEAFSSKKEPKMFIIWEKDAMIDMDTVKEVVNSFHPSGRLVLLSNTNFILENFPIQLEMNYNWKDLDDTSKDEIMNWNLNFQGKNIPVRKIIAKDSEIFSQLPLEKILELEGISLRTTQKLQTKVKKIYIDRTFVYSDFNNDEEYSDHSDNKENSFPCEDILKMIEERKTQIVLESVAGMGKSMTAKHIAEKLKDKNCSKWVEFIDLKQHTSVFFKDSDVCQPKEVDIKFLNEKLLDLQSDLERKLFEHMFNSQNVIFVLDGFDEISPKFKIFVLKLLAAVKESKNQLLITTRTHCKDEINEVVSGSVMRLQPFTKKQSIDLLAQLWQAKSAVNKDRRNSLTHLKADAEKLLEKMENEMKYNRESFEVPLQIVMLSECNELDDELTFDLSSLYLKFIDKKLNIWNEKGPLARDDSNTLQMTRTFVDIHREAAVRVLLGDKIFEELNFKKITDNEEHIVVRIGILIIGINGKIEFVHRTFAEYFLSDYVLLDLQKDIAKSSLFLVLMQGYQHQMVRRFMNDALIKSEDRFKEILSKNITKNLDFKSFTSSLVNVIKEKHLKLLKILLTNEEFKNDKQNFVEGYNHLNRSSLLIGSVQYCTVEMFKDLWNNSATGKSLELQKELSNPKNLLIIWSALYNDDQEMFKYITEIVADLSDLELKKNIFIDALLKSTDRSSSFEAIWTIVKNKFDDADQRQILMKVLTEDDLCLMYAIESNHEGIIKLIFEFTEKYFPNAPEFLKKRFKNHNSYLHLAAQDGSFSVFIIVSTFMLELICEEDFKQILLRKEHRGTILHGIRDELTLIEILKMLEKYLSCNEFFELLNFAHYGKTFLHEVVDNHPINVFKIVWEIMRNKTDNKVQLTDYKKTIFDEFLKSKNEEEINFLKEILNEVEMPGNEMTNGDN